MSREADVLERIFGELKEIKTWIRVVGVQSLRKAIDENLTSDVEKMVYELSNGERSTRDIASELRTMNRSIAHATVASMWKRWAPLGIVEPSEQYRGRFRRVESLTSLGIAVPGIQVPEEEGGNQ